MALENISGKHMKKKKKSRGGDNFPYLFKIFHKVTFSPCSRAIEAERIPRSWFKNVKADSHSEIILVTEEGSPAIVSDDPTARAAYESLRFLKLPKNCNKSMTKGFLIIN